MESGEGFQTNMKLQTKPPAVPCVESGYKPTAGFSAQVGELWSEPRARGLGSGWNHLVAQADLPQIGKSIRSGA